MVADREAAVARDEVGDVGEGGLRTFLRALSDPVVLIDETERVVFANERAGEIFGVSPEALDGVSLLDLSARSGAPEQIRFLRFDLEDGSRQAVLFHAAPEGGVASDDAANRAKSTFLARMSHEIRTPLNVILGYTQLLRDDEAVPRKQRKMLASIRDAGEHLLDLVGEILELSRIESGHDEIELTSVDLVRLAELLETMFRARCVERDLSFEVRVDPTLPRRVVTDEAKLRQILINLLGNAAKFTDAGGIELAFGSDAAGETGTLVVTVSDTGVGIDEDDLSRIFGEFEQTSSGRQLHGGSGLGLSICVELARLLGGELRVQSTRGVGSRFEVRIPLSTGDELRSDPPLPMELVLHADEQGRYRVLVVDDVQQNRDLLAELMADAGFEVRVSPDGQSAVELGCTWRPHLVLMDRLMPGIDGLEATRRMRALESGTHRCVVIVISASTLESNRRESLDAGADAFIAKPLRHRHLIETAGRLLGLELVERAVTEPPKTLRPASAAWDETRLAGLRLPADVRGPLQRAAKTGDIAAFEKLIPRVRMFEPELAARLVPLVDRFDFEALSRLVAEGEPT